MNQRGNLIIAAAVAVIAASGVAWHALTAVDEPHASIQTTFAECGRLDDPPVCLIERSAAFSEDEDFLFGVIRSGGTSLIEANRKRLVSAVQNYRTPVPLPSGTEARAQLRTRTAPVIIAAVALASAAHREDDPFAEPRAKADVAAAGRALQIALTAVTLWDEFHLYQWDRELIRPRGLKAIWHAIAASPPDDPALLNEMALRAAKWSAKDDAAALARATMERLGDEPREPTTSPFVPPQALVDEWRLTKSKAVADQIAGTCLAMLETNPSYPSICAAQVEALRGGGAQDALTAIADKLLVKARKEEEPHQKPDWFSEAADAYLAAGKRPAALEAAREGLRFVEPVMRMHWYGRTPPPLDTPAQKNRAAALTGQAGYSFGAEPVLALYRLGAREEALRFGFLSGFQRYVNAEAAGETPDPQWVIDDHASASVDQMVDLLITKPNAAVAGRFYEALRCERSKIFEPFELPSLEVDLGLLAALAGRREAMTHHFTAAAANIDALSGDTQALNAIIRVFADRPSLDGQTWKAREIFGHRARDLADAWRRGLTILDRVKATADTAPATCAGSGVP
jgi:hypothetical protein